MANVMKKLFISDLHLKDVDAPVTQAFYSFLELEASQADELYILGDFFEYWIGDDNSNTLSISVAKHLKQLSQTHGTQIFFMAGNRDFLVGRTYCAQSGMTLIKEPYRLPGTNILLCHGDAECTSDKEYQKVRQMLRSSEWQDNFLSKSLNDRIAFAEQARIQSKEHQKDYAITDLDDTAIKALLASNNADTLIHGHTHQPGVRNVASSDYKRLTLSDWDNAVWYAQISGNQPPELKQFQCR